MFFRSLGSRLGLLLGLGPWLCADMVREVVGGGVFVVVLGGSWRVNREYERCLVYVYRKAKDIHNRDSL